MNAKKASPKDIQLTGIKHAKQAIADLLNEQTELATERDALREEVRELRAALEAAIPRLLELDKMLNPKLWAEDGAPLALDLTAHHAIHQARAALAKGAA